MRANSANPRNPERRVLLCWEREERNSWNPVLAKLLRYSRCEVTEVHDLAGLREVVLAGFSACLPRFRVGRASFSCVDRLLSESGLPLVNSAETRRRCENKALAHLAFEQAGILQPRSLVIDREGRPDRDERWPGETIVKPLYGARGEGTEIYASQSSAMKHARGRREDVLVQDLVWPARCWRVIVGRTYGAVDPYWRRPHQPGERVLSISANAAIAREPPPPAVEETAIAMLEAVDGDLLAADVLEREGETWALEINHNFDAHGGSEHALPAFLAEIDGARAEVDAPA